MSFSNDDDGDGLAALFGGITPQADPRPAAEARPQPAAQPAPQPTPQPATPSFAPPEPVPAPAAYPGLAPAAPVTPPPLVPVAGSPSYDLPAPSGTAAYPGLAPAPASPAPSPFASAPPGYPAPAEAPPYEAPQYGSPQYSPPQYVPPQPQYEAPQYIPQQPRYDAPPFSAPPDAASAASAAPAPLSASAPAAPAYPPTAQYAAGMNPADPVPGSPPAHEPSRYPGLDAAPGYPPVGGPAYPSTVGAPVPLAEPPAAPAFGAGQAPVPPVASYPPPAFDPPASQPPPLNAPTFDAPAYAAPQADATRFESSGFESLGLQSPPAPAYEPPDYQPAAHEPTPVASAAAEPAVAAESPNVPAVFRAPSGPLLPSSSAAVETPEDLGRSTVGEKVGVAVAALTGPVGLALAIVSAVRSSRRRGWVIGVVRASLVLGVISTILVGIGGVIVWNIQAAALHRADLSAASADFCAAAVADPTMVQAPLLGWPGEANTIQESLDQMTAWTTRWTDLAAKSPKALADDLTLLAAKGQQIVDGVTTARTIDDPGNQAVIASAVAATGVPAWYQTYCVAP